MRALNLKNFTSLPSLDFILGTSRFLGPQEAEVVQNDGLVRHLTSKRYSSTPALGPPFRIFLGC